MAFRNADTCARVMALTSSWRTLAFWTSRRARTSLSAGLARMRPSSTAALRPVACSAPRGSEDLHQHPHIALAWVHLAPLDRGPILHPDLLHAGAAGACGHGFTPTFGENREHGAGPHAHHSVWWRQDPHAD